MEALRSVRKQDFPASDYEIIIVDNAPRSIPALAVLHQPLGMPSLRYIHEPRTGLHHARHAGARAARGEILVYIDDDVICPPEWLTAMIESYSSSQVGMVAGKVELLYEKKPPDWLAQFRDILSALNWGDRPHAVSAPLGPVGCNMSIRKSLLFEVGGFNPDGFGDRRLLRFRGDGECGLARKVHETKWVIWYEPRAFLNHRVPAARMTAEYIKKRSALSGIENAYSSLRYQTLSMSKILYRCLGCLAYSLYYQIMAALHRNNPDDRYLFPSIAILYYHRALQHWRQVTSRDLYLYTKQLTYF